MKKTLLILSGIFVAQAGFSQLTQANEAAIGTSETLFLCDSMAPNLEAIVGAGAVWNYTQLAAYDGETRTITMADATTSPNSSDFPTSTKAFVLEGLIATYFNSTATERTSQGFVFTEQSLGDVIGSFASNPAILMTYPFGLGSSNVDTYAGNVITTIPGATNLPATGSVSSSIDGTGTINFPLGVSVPNVIRYKLTDNAVATTLIGNVEINRVQYEYYDLSTSSLPILLHISITLSIPGGAPETTSLVLSKYSGINNVGIENNESLKFSLYPNPANDLVTFKGELNNAKVSVLNALGQEVMTQTISNGETMNVSELNAGIYLVKVENNGVTSVQRLSID